MSERYLKYSFTPVAGSGAVTLILGSIPGDRSILECEYYAHPQNRFWRVIAFITDSNVPCNYEEKKRMLTDNGIALWDIAGEAVRKGSMDNAIRDAVPNDILTFLHDNATIKKVLFNGKMAEKLYDKYFERLADIIYSSVPSTSPANAAFSFDRLCREWKIVL
ncbi:MAG: DNA-deoxyinosine glycosylase [Bacteroidales bacterium]